jgi:hypothetical protein
MTETVPEFGGCLWPLDPACLTEQWETLPASVRNRAHAMASATLRRLTGHRVGECPVTVRPHGKQRMCFVPSYGAPSWYFSGAFQPGMDANGVWLNACGSCNLQECSVTLPAPATAVHSVKIDGVVLDPATYGLDGNRLVWIGEGDCPFPLTQNVALPDTEPDTFSVTYANGYPVDSLGAYAAGILAMEYAKACSGNGNACRLPIGVTSVVRNGVSIEIASGAFPGGVTGIREVDAYIALWNPKGMTSSPRVWSPDMQSVRSIR